MGDRRPERHLVLIIRLNSPRFEMSKLFAVLRSRTTASLPPSGAVYSVKCSVVPVGERGIHNFDTGQISSSRRTDQKQPPAFPCVDIISWT